jgi:dolichol-phosphate mannosyltransferase
MADRAAASVGHVRQHTEPITVVTHLRSHLYLIVPVLNEAENLPRLFESVRSAQEAHRARFKITVVLVDDGSTDGTGECAKSVSGNVDLALLTHSVNGGPGKAFGTAFAYLADRVQATDFVLTLEGDNTSRLSLLSQMLRRSEEGYDVVLASPYMYGGGIVHTSPVRLFMSHAANAFLKGFLGLHGLLTFSSFYRLHRGNSILRMQEVYGPRIVERDGFESMVEMLMKLVFLGSSISEVAMVLDTSQRGGSSKMNVRRTVLGYGGLLTGQRRWRSAARAASIGRAHRPPPDRPPPSR